MFRKIIHEIRKIRQQKAVILMYHQVCDRKDDPWELAVHPNHFQAHLEYLRKHFDLLSMSDLAEGIAKKKVKRAIAVTFDDGFKDNYHNAAPLLDWLEVPATFYVATTAIQDEKIYWWDALQHVVFHSEVLPRELDLKISGENVHFMFRSDQVLTPRLMNQLRAWNCRLSIPNERVSLYMLLWSRIKPLSYTQQNTVLQEIMDWAGCRDVSFRDCVPMSVREIQILSRNPLFSIGAHSVHHASLSQHNASDQAYEVEESKRQLESWLGKSVNGFAYPYGSYNAVTQQLLRKSGFRYAVSTESKPVTPEDDPFALPRMQVKNWSVYEFASKINEMIHE